jgi:hypothetical protein
VDGCIHAYVNNFATALFRCTQKPKTLQDSSSHRNLRHSHRTLNIDKKDK